MSIERLRSQGSQMIHGASMNAVERFAGTPVAKNLMRGASGYLIERGMDLFEYKGLEESINETIPYLEDGHKLVILSSHKSHAEIAPGIHLMEEFMNRAPSHLKDFVIPVAASMAGGQQGNIIKTLYEETLVPNTAKRRIKTVPVVTDNDVLKRGMEKSLMANGLAISRPLKKDGTGFFVFIEGSVQGGRKNPETGDIYGLQEPDALLSQLLEYSRKTKTKMVFVMAGMSNTHKLFSADGKFFTPEWARAMVVNRFNRNAKYASVNMSRPTSTDRMDLDDIDQAAENLMVILASHLPEEERGEYRDSDYLLNT